MASVGLSDIVMDTTVTHTTIHGRAHSVEECRYLPQWDCEPWDTLWGRGELAGLWSLQPFSWSYPHRCPIGYSGLSCESCDAHFTRVPGGPYLGTCSGCNCNGHASSCDPVYGHCLVSSARYHLDTGWEWGSPTSVNTASFLDWLEWLPWPSDALTRVQDLERWPRG